MDGPQGGDVRADSTWGAALRIVRQLLTESLLLAGFGGIAGLSSPSQEPRCCWPWRFPVRRACRFTPVLRRRPWLCFRILVTDRRAVRSCSCLDRIRAPNLSKRLRSGTRVAGGATLLQRGLVVVQATLSLVLLVGAGLFSQSLDKLQHKDLKLDPKTATSSTSTRRLQGIRSASWRSLSNHRSAVSCDRRRRQSRYLLIHAHGGRQQRLGGSGSREARCQLRTPRQLGPVRNTSIPLERMLSWAGNWRAGYRDLPEVAVVNETFVRKIL